jgi:hypothetical protein
MRGNKAKTHVSTRKQIVLQSASLHRVKILFQLSIEHHRELSQYLFVAKSGGSALEQDFKAALLTLIIYSHGDAMQGGLGCLFPGIKFK